MYDYLAGKADWLGWGLAYEGTAHLVGGEIDTDVPRRALAALPDPPAVDDCVVVNEHGVVMGAVKDGRYSFGVTTVRPSEDVHALEKRMREQGVSELVVTRQDGVLLGVYRAGE